MKKESLSEACERIHKEAEELERSSGRQWLNRIIDIETNTIDIGHVEVGESEQSHEIRKLLYNPLNKKEDDGLRE